MAAQRVLHRIANVASVLFNVALEFWRQGAVAGRHGIVGRALKYGEVGTLFRDHWRRLHSG